MKLKTMIVAALIAVSATAAYAGFQCKFCAGSGWKNGVKCIHCGGDGEVGN